MIPLSELSKNPLVTYVLATYNRPDDLTEAMESILDQEYSPIEIVVVSSSTDRTSGMFTDGGRFDRDGIRYLHYSERMGVPKARNIGYENSRGEVIATIDDDAVLADSGATTEIVSQFRTHDDVGVLAFQSRGFQTDEPILWEIPSPPDFQLPPPKQRMSTFCGVGNAIRRSVLETVGLFAEDFVYAFEEQDLSMRIIDAGYDILYVPSVVVYHKQSSKARLPDTETQQRRIENRIKIAIRNLPLRYVVLTTLIWSIYGFVRTAPNPLLMVTVYRRLYERRAELCAERDVISAKTIALLKARSTLLFGWWYGPHPRRFLENPKRLTW